MAMASSASLQLVHQHFRCIANLAQDGQGGRGGGASSAVIESVFPRRDQFLSKNTFTTISLRTLQAGVAIASTAESNWKQKLAAADEVADKSRRVTALAQAEYKKKQAEIRVRQDLAKSDIVSLASLEFAPYLTEGGKVTDFSKVDAKASVYAISNETKVLENVSVTRAIPNAKSYDLPSRTLYLVDVHPLCYHGKRPRPSAILNWMKLFFDQVSLEGPVIAVMDGERGNEYRKGLFPNYKEKRNKYKPVTGIRGPYFKGDEMDLREAFPYIQAFLYECNVQVVKIEDAEADDVIATLMQQALTKGMRVAVASPDMDYRQLLREDVNMVLPLPEFGRWSFYTLQQYRSEHDCDPHVDLGLRCMLGDQSDSVPGLADLAPGFGRKTALKLMKKHGSLENLLLTAKTRTVGKPYIQDALSQHRDILYRNLQVLSLRRDIDVTLKEDWCRPRDRSNEAEAFKRLRECLQTKSRSLIH